MTKSKMQARVAEVKHLVDSGNIRAVMSRSINAQVADDVVVMLGRVIDRISQLDHVMADELELYLND